MMLCLNLLLVMLITCNKTACVFKGIEYISRLIKSQEARVVQSLLYNVSKQDDNLFEALAVFNYNLEQLVPMMQDKRFEIVHIVRNLVKQQGPVFIHGISYDTDIIKKNLNYTDADIATMRGMLKKTASLWNRVVDSYPNHKPWLDKMYSQWFDRL